MLACILQPCGRILRLLLLGSLPALGACGDGSDRSASDVSAFTVRDSAGVQREAMAASFEAMALEDEEDRAMIEAYLEGMKYPETLPTASELMSDAEGHLLVRPFALPFEEEGAPPFMVFDADGRLLGEVAFPVRFEPRAITDERVYGVWTDELDIEQVRVYALRRG